MAEKAKRKSLLDDVLSRALRNKPGFKTWFDRLPPEAQVQLLEVKKAFNPKEHQKNAYASSIIESCRERGWQTAGRQGVIDWLDRP